MTSRVKPRVRHAVKPGQSRPHWAVTVMDYAHLAMTSASEGKVIAYTNKCKRSLTNTTNPKNLLFFSSNQQSTTTTTTSLHYSCCDAVNTIIITGLLVGL